MTSELDLGVLFPVKAISGADLAASVISSMISERVPIALRQRWIRRETRRVRGH